MKEKKDKNFYAPFEQLIIETIIECYDLLNDKNNDDVICDSIKEKMETFIRKGYLKEIKDINIDRDEKTITVIYSIESKQKDFYSAPETTELGLGVSWKNLSKEQVDNFLKKKEEIIKNGIAGPNCEIVG